VTRAATEAKLWYAQRLSAMVLALCVVAHLCVIVYAARGGLTAVELLGRTRGNLAFALYYGAFVLACAVHVPIGLKSIAREWFGWREPGANAGALTFGALVLVLGLRAVYAVFGAQAT
jgi:fumarate reductase subunit C